MSASVCYGSTAEPFLFGRTYYDPQPSAPVRTPVVRVDHVFEMDPMLFAGRNPRARQAARHGKNWCHLWVDSNSPEDLNALHEMARKIGLKREWFQDRKGFPHYDLVPSKRAKAIASGAVQTDLREWVTERRRKGL